MSNSSNNSLIEVGAIFELFGYKAEITEVSPKRVAYTYQGKKHTLTFEDFNRCFGKNVAFTV